MSSREVHSQNTPAVQWHSRVPPFWHTLLCQMKTKQKWQSNCNYRKIRKYSRNTYYFGSCYHDARSPCVNAEEMISPHRNSMISMWTGFISDAYVTPYSNRSKEKWSIKEARACFLEEEKEFCVVFMTLEVERDSNQKGFKARNEKHDRTQLIGTRKEKFWGCTGTSREDWQKDKEEGRVGKEG